MRIGVSGSPLPAVTTLTPSTRERILDAAFELFVEVGFAGTKITEIERRVGLSSGSGGFYRHFHSKVDLLRPTVERQVALYMAAIEDRQSLRPRMEGAPANRENWITEMLENVRLFDPVIRFMLADGHRVPEVREAVGSVLRAHGQQMSWQQQPELMVCLIALSGYHLLSEVQGQPFQDFPQADFIRVLAQMASENP